MQRCLSRERRHSALFHVMCFCKLPSMHCREHNRPGRHVHCIVSTELLSYQRLQTLLLMGPTAAGSFPQTLGWIRDVHPQALPVPGGKAPAHLASAERRVSIASGQLLHSHPDQRDLYRGTCWDFHIRTRPENFFTFLF